MAPSCKFMELCINFMLSTSVKANMRKIQKVLLCFVRFSCEMMFYQPIYSHNVNDPYKQLIPGLQSQIGQ